MPARCVCISKDGKEISGSARWLPDESERMNVTDLLRVLGQIREFAHYYNTAFHKPLCSLETRAVKLDSMYSRARRTVSVFAGATMAVTAAWLFTVLFECGRFSTASFILAVLTLACAGCFLPVLLWFVSQTEAYRKQMASLDAQKRELLAEQERKILGEYSDQLISGYLLLPQYSLCEDALDIMIQRLTDGIADSLKGAAEYCTECLHDLSCDVLLTRCISLEYAAEKKAGYALSAQESRQDDLSIAGIREKLRMASEKLEKMRTAVSDEDLTGSEGETLLMDTLFM